MKCSDLHWRGVSPKLTLFSLICQMRRLDPSAATEVAAAVTVATAPREGQPAVTDRQVKMVRLSRHVLSFSRDKLIVNTSMLCSSFVVASICLTVCFVFNVLSECR